ncbi:acyl-CoA thioesterase [Sandarakinorhabdus sp. DWP1-3-1]|uniref:acyl-CoA thioesterase n=1 Tax=Sandarakinorhabdus sp. DWP1-3-1 TaxID=2804627 RepID=UPI003CE9F071
MSLILPLPTDDPLRFRLDVTPQLCVGHPDSQFLFGGAGMASGLAAIEAATGRQTVWAAAQYLSYARPGTTLDLDVVVPVSGKYTSQARVTARAGDTEIFTVNAALGARPDAPEAQWAAMPDVPRPEDCPAMEYNWIRRADDINGSFHQRVAAGRFGVARREGGPSPDGIARLWCAPVDASVTVDRILLGIIGDFLPSGIGNALGTNAGGNSLDNTIRFARLVPTRWVLADIRIHATAQGFAHGRVHLFAEDGTLLATASQSVILRIH